MTIFRRFSYQDDKGRVLVETEIVEGQAPEGFSRFSAPVRVSVARDASGNVAFAEGMAPIDAMDVVEAFEKMDESVRAASKTIRSEAMRQMSKPHLVLPDGKHP